MLSKRPCKLNNKVMNVFHISNRLIFSENLQLIHVGIYRS